MPETTEERPYCTQPTLAGEAVAFVTAGDVWTVTAGQKLARRLTTLAGTASQPRMSPDGSLVAFGARDEGPVGLHVMPARGGEARRLVHHSAPCEPAAFSPDGRRVYFVSTLASTNPRSPELFSVSIAGGDVEREPLGPASGVALAADGRIVVARGYQDPARWKRYAGGLAGQLWAGTRDPLDVRHLALGRRGASQPSFWGERIVFVSDEDGCGNVWSCRMDGTDAHRHSSHREYYVRWPSVSGSRVVYQHAGDLWLLDLETDRAERLDVDMAADVSTVKRRYVDPSRFLERAEPSPDADRVLLTARGKVVALPAWRGAARYVGDVDGVRFEHACWLPDGESVVLAQDSSGEEELEVRHVDGKTPPRSLGRLGNGRIRCLQASPDGKWLAVSEQSAGLVVVELASGERTPVDRAESGAITDVSWSPDSRWLAYARPKRWRSTLVLFEVATGARHPLTGPEFDDAAPCFDPAGRYLYFLSRRIYNPYADELQHDVAFPATTKPYAFVLSGDRPSPFAPLPTDELGLDDDAAAGAARRDGEARDERPESEKPEAAAEEDEQEKDAPEERAGKRPDAIRIDLEGLPGRIVEFPVREGRYAAIVATRERVFLLRRPLLGMIGGGGEGDGEEGRLARLVAFELETREEKPWANDVREVSLSGDGKTLLLRGATDVRLVSSSKAPQNAAVSAGKPGEKTGVLDLHRMRLRIDPRAEWRQIFREAWRQQRGHFWTECMTSIEWDAMHDRYAPLARRVRTREELSDVLWDMQGELGTSHAYVVGGDEPWRPHYRTGLLGADLRVDPASGRYRIERILSGDTWMAGAHSPLALPGVNVREGDYLLAVEGREAIPPVHPWTLLERPGPAVTLTIGSRPDGSDAREVVVAPLSSEYRCRYREWVKANQALVDARSGGRVGYLHLPDMQVAGLVEFHRGFLWQAHRQGLIVDVRDNGGGNVSQILLEKLNRKLIGYVKARWAEPEALPDNTVVGPMVALCNERTGSDGDIFCQSWKQMGLGPLIGTRTWGGVIGIDRSRTLVDGGYTTQPEYAYWFLERGWDVEGTGVEPDIVVESSPVSHARGEDPQLERAIAEVLRRIEERGPQHVELPPPPDRAWRPT